MYVCLCFGIKEDEIKKAIEEGAQTLPELMDTLNIAAACGSCRPYVEEILSTTLCTVCGLKPNSCCDDTEQLTIPIVELK